VKLHIFYSASCNFCGKRAQTRDIIVVDKSSQFTASACPKCLPVHREEHSFTRTILLEGYEAKKGAKNEIQPSCA